MFNPAFGQTPAPNKGADFAFPAAFGADENFAAGFFLGAAFLAKDLEEGFFDDGGILISLRLKGGGKILYVPYLNHRLKCNANETTTL